MFIFTDYGCYKHQPREVTFDGPQATMMANFMANLPMVAGNYTYICEHGHTHSLILHPCEEKMNSRAPGLGYAGNTLPAY
jgi:hypothetical protein